MRDEIYEEVMARAGATSAGLRPALRLRRPGRLEPAHAAGVLHRPQRPAHAQPPWTRSAAGEGRLVADGLVYRYDLERRRTASGPEGTFNMCTFWLVEALTRAGRGDPARLDEARLMFEQMLGYANHLGLYAEQTGRSGEALGNFPQASPLLSP